MKNMNSPVWFLSGALCVSLLFPLLQKQKGNRQSQVSQNQLSQSQLSQNQLLAPTTETIFSPAQAAPVPSPRMGVNPARAVSTAIADSVERVLPSVVIIRTTATQRYLDFWRRKEILRDEEVGQGSGVIIDAKEGYIITNNHVLQKAQKVSVVLWNGVEVPARFIGSNVQTDIAILKIDPPKDTKLIEIVPGDSDEIRVGEMCLAIGSPYALSSTVTQGIISYKGRDAEVLPVVDFIQVSAAINPGNSGGPLVDVDGALIGINTFIQTAQPGAKGNIGIGFAVPSNLALRIAEMIVKGEDAELSFIGIVMGDTRQGVGIMNVMKQSPAAKAGLKTGDLILEVNRKRVRSSDELKTLIMVAKPGSKVHLRLIRDGAEREANVITEKMPNMRAF